MAVNVPNPGAYQVQLGQHCVDFRDALQRLLTDANYINTMGGATFLTTQIGMSAADAAAVVASVGAVTPANSVVQQLQAFIASTTFLQGGG